MHRTRKPREKPRLYSRKPKAIKQKDGPRTSTTLAMVTMNKRKNRTLFDWTTAFKFMDDHPDMSQMDVVNHFKSKVDGALVFDQGTLSRNPVAGVTVLARAVTNAMRYEKVHCSRKSACKTNFWKHTVQTQYRPYIKLASVENHPQHNRGYSPVVASTGAGSRKGSVGVEIKNMYENNHGPNRNAGLSIFMFSAR
ncbi:hypothetical protein BD779DRAFT_1791246 [Infundibulicybe gibba]|nr:hypothetical protein BD779DRAFT_1791246 [Infundibulicybe gibba]